MSALLSSPETSAPPPPAGPGRALAIIDYGDHSRGGHYGPYLSWFVREFSSRFERILVFTPEPANTVKLPGLSASEAPRNASFHSLPLGQRKLFFRAKRHPCLPSLVFEKAAQLAPGFSLQGFIMWGFDLLQIRGMAKQRSGAPWATIGSVSHVKRHCAGRWIEKETKLERLCVEHPDGVALLVWDHYMVSPESPKIQWLPGLETSNVASSSPLAATIRDHAQGRFCIGAFGTLSGPRCLNELLPLVQRHPEIRFVLVGVIDQKRIRKDLLGLLTTERPENLLLVTGFQKDEDFNAGIAACDALMIDGVAYPVHSGIVTKALLLGKGVLTPESNSWTSDMIRDHGVGIAYRDPGMDLTQAWKEWQQSGGPERSTQAAHALLNPKVIAHCFDLISRRFREAAAPGSFSDPQKTPAPYV